MFSFNAFFVRGRRGFLAWAVATCLFAGTAEAARYRRHARDLVLAPSGSELLLLPQTRPSVRVLNLTRTIPDTVEAQDYLGEIWAAINDTFAEGGRVYAHGLRGPVSGRLNASWDVVRDRHRVSLAQVEALVEQDFDRRAAPWLGPDVDELLPRKKGPPPERPRPAR